MTATLLVLKVLVERHGQAMGRVTLALIIDRAACAPLGRALNKLGGGS